METGDDRQLESKEHSPSQLPRRTVPFFAALRKLQTRAQSLIGRDTRPSKEPVRLRAEPSLAYPAAEVAQASVDSAGRTELEVSFLGLFGPSGTLPLHYTQLIIDRKRHKDHTLREFLDLFNHRWLSLFYRAWEKQDYPSAFQTSRSLGEEDVVTRILWCLIGLGTQGQRGRLRLNEQALLHFSGHLSNSQPRETALRAMVSQWFSVAVEVLQFQGQWIQIPDPELSQLPGISLGVSSNNRLGTDTVAGSRVWNVENRFRLRLGPMSLAEFINFSPLGERLTEVSALVRTYVGGQFEFDIQVLLERSEVPGTTLTGGPGASRLGWNTWLGNWPFDRDADDAVFEIDDALTVVGEKTTGS